MQMQERQAQLKEFEAVINLLDKFDIPDEPKTKMLQQLPTLMPRFSSLAPYLEGATWRGKKEIETEFAVQPGQVIKNPITQEPYPEGTKLKGTARMVNGQPVFSKLAPVKVEQATNMEDRVAQTMGFSSFEQAPLTAKQKIMDEARKERIADRGAMAGAAAGAA